MQQPDCLAKRLKVEWKWIFSAKNKRARQRAMRLRHIGRREEATCTSAKRRTLQLRLALKPGERQVSPIWCMRLHECLTQNTVFAYRICEAPAVATAGLATRVTNGACVSKHLISASPIVLVAPTARIDTLAASARAIADRRCAPAGLPRENVTPIYASAARHAMRMQVADGA